MNEAHLAKNPAHYDDNVIHHTAQVHPAATLGKGNTIGAGAIIKMCVVMGDNNIIDPYAVIGSAAEYRGKMSQGSVLIGNRNHIGEHVTIHQSMDGEEATWIQDDCYIMTKVHIGHDAIIGNFATLASGCIIGGHTMIGAMANIGLGAVIHQKRVIGEYAMIGMNSTVTRSIPPYVVAIGSPCKPERINVVGLKRREMSDTFVSAAQFWLNDLKTGMKVTNDMSGVIYEIVGAWRADVDGLEGK